MKDGKKSLCGKSKAREVVLLGPCAPLYPAPFFSKGITVIMETLIIDPRTMLTVVEEARGTKKLHQYCGEKVEYIRTRNVKK